MLKKETFLIMLVLVLFSNFAFAQDATNSTDLDDMIDKAYQCLEDQLDEKDEGSISLEEAIFSTLAIGSDSKLKEVIEDNKDSRANCWPDKGCKIKETSQVLLAKDRTGSSTKTVKDWLLSKSKAPSELIWYLQIDIRNHVESQCKINYKGSQRNIVVKEDMKLEGSPGNCLEFGYGGYWLKVANSCLEEEFEISCDQDFVTSLAYQRQGSSSVYVVSDASSGSSLGTTTEKIGAKCFATDNLCDYEGTLWAAIALQQDGESIKPYLPYLIALSETNSKYFPSTFLYILNSGESYYADIISKQKQSQYWNIVGSPYGRYYDTSLALLSLTGSGSSEATATEGYLLSVQDKNGCWNNNNIKDTAFLLYSGWRVDGERDTDSSGDIISCLSKGFTCESPFECTAAGGNILHEYSCSELAGQKLCCSVPVVKQSCSEKGGHLCSTNQQCEGNLESSLDGSCCIGSCVNKQIEDTCTSISKGVCRTTCFSNENQISSQCADAAQVCCTETTEATEESSSWWPVAILLFLLIALIVIAIIYKDKLRFWWHKWRGDVRTSKVPG